jgi:hypothetical protein
LYKLTKLTSDQPPSTDFPTNSGDRPGSGTKLVMHALRVPSLTRIPSADAAYIMNLRAWTMLKKNVNLHPSPYLKLPIPLPR